MCQGSSATFENFEKEEEEEEEKWENLWIKGLFPCLMIRIPFV